MNKIPTDGLYDGSESLSSFHDRRNWPINDPPSIYQKSGEPTVMPGQLVQWVKHPDTDAEPGWYTPHYVNKHVGIVLKTRWTLADWVPYDNKDPTIYPEALILWADGETTNTSHSAICDLK